MTEYKTVIISTSVNNTNSSKNGTEGEDEHMEGRKFVARVVIIVVGFYILMAVIGSIFDCNKLLVIYKTDKIEDSQFQQVS